MGSRSGSQPPSREPPIKRVTAGSLAAARRELAVESHLCSDDAMKWTEWSDTKFAPMVYPNITRSIRECYDTLGYVDQVTEWGFVERQVVRTAGALGMGLAHGKIKKKYGIEDEREALLGRVDEWVAEGVAGQPFRGGQAPDLSDLAVYGAIAAVSGTEAAGELRQHAGLNDWLRRVEDLL